MYGSQTLLKYTRTLPQSCHILHIPRNKETATVHIYMSLRTIKYSFMRSKHFLTSNTDTHVSKLQKFFYTCPPKHTNTISYTQNHSNKSFVDITQIEIRSEQVQKFQYGTIVRKHS